MNKETLDELNLSELISLCRNREIRIPRNNKGQAIQRLITYHKKNEYTKLEFKDMKKEVLITEGKAVGATNITTKTKKDIVNIIMNPPSPIPQKNKENHSNSNNKNKNLRTPKPKNTKLNQKTQSIITCCTQLEGIMVDIFNDLKLGFKPIDESDNKTLPHHFEDYKEFPTLSEDLIDDLDEFGDKILTLLPRILEAKSMVHDFHEYVDEIAKSEKQKSNENKKQIYYLAMRKYKNTNDYNQDEIGPICGVFDDSKQFDTFKKDKKIIKKYGKNIVKVKFNADNNNKNSVNVNVHRNKNKNKMEAESDEENKNSEAELSEEDMVSDTEANDDNASVATVEALDELRKKNDDMLVESSDENDEMEHNENKDGEETEDEDDIENENEDEDIDMNKNKKKDKNNKDKNVLRTKTTRSRRKAKKKVSGKKRKREEDDVVESDKKRAKLDENVDNVQVDPLSG